VICVAYASFSLEGRNRLLNKFASIRSDVSVDITAAEWTDDVVQMVKSGGADFGIAFGPIEDANIEQCELEPLELTIAFPKENPLANKTAISLSDLEGQRVAFTIKDAKSMAATQRYSWLLNAGVDPVHVPEGRRYIFDVAQEKRLAVVCYTPSDVVPDDFIRRPFKDKLPPFTLILVRAKRIMSPSAERLWRLAHEMGKKSEKT
jgi:DNA-binding transcriptional LysR family regulator